MVLVDYIGMFCEQQRIVGSESGCVLSIATYLPTDFVSMWMHNKNPNKGVVLVQRGYHHYLFNIDISVLVQRGHRHHLFNIDIAVLVQRGHIIISLTLI